ncbi:nitrite reductase large subunit NirB [Niallia endozanthoxylica]|uniref:NAD(P)/FAD-dependent oxidoreductase n=1 Tax=Niallia endozanthoxylica TaxID=2036016 RepID=A0A5J5HQC3_9BACI|nr:nitrite reductase large subunit NirB [Niallia endozanthoxylica]KAA9023963.1 NAD(P)/FAD-dependent oxidoreductase [Niallia endozanthoxylica]
MGKRRLVVVGNGMAGVRCVEEILKINRDAFQITIFGKEPYPNYNRIMLSKVLQGGTTVESIMLNDWKWYEENCITLYTDESVIELNTKEKWVMSSKRRKVNYDELILATGSNPFMLPLPGADKLGVMAFRTIQDCEKMVRIAKKHKKAIVIGGGLLGLEAARGLLNLGMKVDVVHIGDYIMNRQLDVTAANMLQKELEKQGMNFLLKKYSVEITGHQRVKGLRFSDGTWREADLVVMAVGVTPNIKLAERTSININRAIVVDDFMRTNVANVYAVGECAEHRGIVYGLVAPLYEQGKVLAAYVCGTNPVGYQGTILSTQLKISGVDVFSTGEMMETNENTSLKWYDGIKNTYKKLVFHQNKLVGAVLFGDIQEGGRFLRLIEKQTDYRELVNETNGREEQNTYVAKMADYEKVCECNGVSKGEIVEAIVGHSLKSVEEIKVCTKASSSCGGCRSTVASLLDYVQQNGASQRKEKESICACTQANHQEVIESIRKFPHDSKEQIMQHLDWENPSGCAYCQSALRYYLGVHSQGNMEMTESKQADGTFVIAPRMYGGVTGAEQLRLIADVVEEFKIPLVKLAKGPRMELYGVQEKDVKMIRKMLQTPVPVYGGSLRAVATCAGIGYAKDAMQDSIQLGINLEQLLESVQLPTDVTLAVSASPRDEINVIQEDVGLIGAPGGWELFVKQERIFSGLMEYEAVMMTSALLHMYREQAYFLEPLPEWVRRIGVIAVREEIFQRKMRVFEEKQLELFAGQVNG